MNRRQILTVKEKLLKISTIEGISLLLLVFVAMPLKYLAGYKIATLIMGSIHGILWLVFLYYLNEFKKVENPPKDLLVKLLISSVVPFGFIYAKKILDK